MDPTQVKYQKTNFQKYEFLDYLPVIEKGELDRVYRPNDDSYLMLDILNLEAKNTIREGAIIVEIGSGSGILINHLTKFLEKEKKRASFCLGIDINFDACVLTQKYGQHYQAQVLDCFNANITSGLRLDGKVDVVICNPPYVPTDQDELQRAMENLKLKDKLLKEGKMEEMKNVNCIDASYAGGFDGMEITGLMIDQSLTLLVVGGSLYVFLIFENNIEEIIKQKACLNGREYKWIVLINQRKYNELQYVLQAERII